MNKFVVGFVTLLVSSVPSFADELPKQFRFENGDMFALSQTSGPYKLEVQELEGDFKSFIEKFFEPFKNDEKTKIEKVPDYKAKVGTFTIRRISDGKAPMEFGAVAFHKEGKSVF